jgi:hypothetical protein
VKRAASRRAGRPALELIEAAVHLLRTAPVGALLAYYIGSVPCVLGLLYFLADMAGGALARGRLIEASLNAAGFYLWMKCWHAVFASKLRSHLLLETEAPWTPARVGRLVLTQIAVQPSGLFVRLFAAQVLIPYVWVYSFYQNVGVLGDGTRGKIREVIREAARQAGLWQRQAHGALFGLFGFALLVWLNVSVLLGLAPMMLKTFFGIETIFSQSPWTMVNTTTFAATVAATYLCFDPIRKALFVLRCFHGASLQTGEDLRVELKSLRHRAGALAGGIILIFAGLGGPLSAATPPPPRVESAELNDSLDRVLQRREYTWRLPRQAIAEEDANKGWLATFFEEAWKKLVRTVQKVRKWVADAYEWLRKVFQKRPSADESGSSGGRPDWPMVARWTLVALVAVLLGILGVLLLRWRKARRAGVVMAQAVAAVPDLNEEDVTADQLPEDGWLRLAQELAAKGDLRLALRASYLAGLAHLGHRELIRIARHKSNRDYERELQRRARGNAGLLDAFDQNLISFERSWYGEHAVTPVTIGSFSENLERIRAC